MYPKKEPKGSLKSKIRAIECSSYKLQLEKMHTKRRNKIVRTISRGRSKRFCAAANACNCNPRRRPNNTLILICAESTNNPITISVQHSSYITRHSIFSTQQCVSSRCTRHNPYCTARLQVFILSTNGHQRIMKYSSPSSH